ncbi:MAG: hypothetical protein OEY52_07305 [Gammaproteobacteria bacterium]|nr:hypothetical protein [Gammaproteobacteria bacterium]
MWRNSKPVQLTGRISVGLFTIILVLSGCGSGENINKSARTDNTPNIAMDVPPSLTGSQQNFVGQSGVNALAYSSAANAVGQPCAYLVDDKEDHFRNGYQMTKLLVSAIATWSCIGDLLIDVSNFVDHDGAIHETDNNRDSEFYKPEDPTHYSVTDDSDSQTTVKMYYGYYRDTPPIPEDEPQFYISWNESGDDTLQGRIIVDARTINPGNRKLEDPIMLRMDFNYTSDEKAVDMFLRFDGGNKWAEGFRIHLVKDMNANPLESVYLARGLIEMKAQFLPVASIKEIPVVQLYTVSNRSGDGAAIAKFLDVSLPLKLSGGIIDNHLGNYLFSRDDKYYFDKQGQSDWIYKLVTDSEYRGGRTTPEIDGSWIPFNPSLDLIAGESGLNLGSDYFTDSKCAKINDKCNPLLNAIFDQHKYFDELEHNLGTEPQDWRSKAISNPINLESVYPNGHDWTDAFEFSFTPSI